MWTVPDCCQAAKCQGGRPAKETVTKICYCVLRVFLQPTKSCLELVKKTYQNRISITDLTQRKRNLLGCFAASFTQPPRGKSNKRIFFRLRWRLQQWQSFQWHHWIIRCLFKKKTSNENLQRDMVVAIILMCNASKYPPWQLTYPLPHNFNPSALNTNLVVSWNPNPSENANVKLDHESPRIRGWT